MAGNSPGAIRAAILCSAALLAPLLRRTADSITSLSAALLLLLLWNPFSIANAGLQFSFAATIGIYLVGQPLYQYWRRPLPRKWQRILSFPCSVLAVSLGSMLFTLPLTAWYFGHFPLIAPLSNVLTHWSASLSFLGGVLSICSGAIWQPLGLVIAAIINLPLAFFLFCARALAKLPFAALSLQSSYYLAFLLFLYCLILLYAFFWRRGSRRPIYPLCACVFALCLSMLLTSITSWKTPFSLTVLDVGQGQSIALSSGGYRALIDCGGSKQAGSIASDFLSNQGATSLDLLVLTHYHEDHINGVSELMSRIDVHTIAVPDSYDSGRETIEALALQYHSEIWYIDEESHIPFGQGELVLYPPLSLVEDNEAGLSILPTFHQWEALITGDMGEEREGDLLRAYPLPDIELFILGHHGSRYSSGPALLEALSPELSVVSVGHNNYGHPAEETIKRLSDFGITLYRTDQMGHITISVYD